MWHDIVSLITTILVVSITLDYVRLRWFSR